LPAANLALIFLAFIVLLFSLTVHEAAHAWTANRLGDPTARLLGRISLNPIVHADPIGTILFPIIALVSGVPVIGWAKPVPVNVARLRNGRRDYVFVAAAGPLSNLLLAVVASAGASLLASGPAPLGDAGVSRPLTEMLSMALQLNVLLAVFNMIPVPPLDGGNVLSGLLPVSGARAIDALRPYGFLLIYAIVLTPAFDYIVLRPAGLLLSFL
jgi:Zn-dependent protease